MIIKNQHGSIILETETDTLRKGDFSAKYLIDAALGHSDIDYAKFVGADARFADFRFCFAICADFTGCDLRGADFQGASLHGAIFVDANLWGTDFRGAELGEMVFVDCDLRHAKFSKNAWYAVQHKRPAKELPALEV